jgi:hypothetical protein
MPNKKKSSSPTIWYNSLAKFKSKLHSGILKEIKLCVCPSAFWKLTSGILFYSFFFFFFTLPPTGKRRWQPQSTRAYMCAGRWVLPSFYFCQVCLSNSYMLFFLVLLKLDGCQVDLPNCWSCSLHLRLNEQTISLGYFYIWKEVICHCQTISKSLSIFICQILYFVNF